MADIKKIQTPGFPSLVPPAPPRPTPKSRLQGAKSKWPQTQI